MSGFTIGEKVYVDFGGYDPVNHSNKSKARGYASGGTIEMINKVNADFQYDVFMDNIGCYICGVSSKFVKGYESE